MSVDLAARLAVTPDVLIQHIDGESVLLNVQSGRYFGLDSVGTRAWQLVTTGSNLDSALATMAGEYDVDAEVLRGDVQELLRRLLELGLLRIECPASAA